MKRAAIVLGVLSFLAVSLLVARWLYADSVERAAVEALLRDQARGDAAAMRRRLDCPDVRCAAVARANAQRLRLRPGAEIEIVRYDSASARALGSTTEPTRVVWTAPGRLTTVQCVLVRREGDPAAGISVTLVRVSAPIGRESSCR